MSNSIIIIMWYIVRGSFEVDLANNDYGQSQLYEGGFMNAHKVIIYL